MGYLTRIPSDDMLDEWVLLRDSGVRVPVAARRIGTTQAALEKCLERALNRGDRRGSRHMFGNEPRSWRPTLELPVDEFDWTYRDANHYNSHREHDAVFARPCETCGAPPSAICITRHGERLWKLHAARKRAPRAVAA